MGIPSESYVNKLTVIPLRGDLRSLAEMEIELQQFDRGQFSVMLWDAKYRFETGDENSNANEAALYNRLDSIARQSGAAQILIHHASKGSQSDKRITDVGAGAGAQSRAADCHIVLREHEEPGVVVLDAAVRSFPPVDPLAVKWVFPLFTPAGDVDCRKLKGNQSQRDLQQQARDREAMDQIIEALRDGSGTARQLRSATGFSRERLQRLLDLMESQGHLTSEETSVKGNKCHEYTLNYD